MSNASPRPRPRRGILAMLALGTLAVALGAVPARAQNLDVKEVVLDNGLTAPPRARARAIPNVAAGWIAKVGSVNERPGITGLSHLFEHMMFKGTHVDRHHRTSRRTWRSSMSSRRAPDRARADQARPEHARAERRGEIDDAFDPRRPQPAARPAAGAEFDGSSSSEAEGAAGRQRVRQDLHRPGGSGMNAGTTKDFTIYFINLPANKLELWFWMESDRLETRSSASSTPSATWCWEERRMRTTPPRPASSTSSSTPCSGCPRRTPGR